MKNKENLIVIQVQKKRIETDLLDNWDIEDSSKDFEISISNVLNKI